MSTPPTKHYHYRHNRHYTINNSAQHPPGIIRNRGKPSRHHSHNRQYSSYVKKVSSHGKIPSRSPSNSSTNKPPLPNQLHGSTPHSIRAIS